MIEITRPGKQSLIIENPVIIAAGMMGFEPSAYRDLIKLEKLGAMVTTPITWKARGPAHGTRVAPFPAGFLLHTGLPNPGMTRVIKHYSRAWRTSELPVIVHIVATNRDDVRHCAEALEGVEGVVGLELGLHDQVEPQEVVPLIAGLREHSQLPLLVKLPLYDALYLVEAATDGGADALVIASSPRGTEHDPLSGRLIGGRVFGPWLKSQVLRALGQIAGSATLPLIACGGIHTADDARDFISAGAVAVQIDTLTWVQPSMVEIIARNLGGLELTRQMGALADEWEPGLGKTQMMKRRRPRQSTPPATPRPSALPEQPSWTDGDTTEAAEPTDEF
jgi:dihydroorotate dehydrogenase (NAD+) catalytic subunit